MDNFTFTSPTFNVTKAVVTCGMRGFLIGELKSIAYFTHKTVLVDTVWFVCKCHSARTRYVDVFCDFPHGLQWIVSI